MAIPADVSNCTFSGSTLVDPCGLDRYQIGKLIYRPASLAPFWAGQGFQSLLYASRRLGRSLGRNFEHVLKLEPLLHSPFKRHRFGVLGPGPSLKCVSIRTLEQLK